VYAKEAAEWSDLAKAKCAAALQQLTQSESLYCDDMQQLLDSYLGPIKTGRVVKLGPTEAVNSLYISLSALVNSHRKISFGLALASSCANSEQTSSSSSSLPAELSAFSMSYTLVATLRQELKGLLEHYHPYMTQLPSLEALFEDTKNAELQAFLRNMSAIVGRDVKSLIQLSRMPIERVSVYVGFFDKISEVLADKHPTHTGVALVAAARGEASALQATLFSSYKIATNTSALLDLQAQVTHIPDAWQVLSPSRYLVKTGVATHVFEMGQYEQPESHPHRSKKAETVRVCVFNDCVLITNWAYKYRLRLVLNQDLTVTKRYTAMVGLMPDAFSVSVDSSANISLLFSDPAERDEWHETLLTARDNHTAVLKQKASASSDSAASSSSALSSSSSPSVGAKLQKVDVVLRVRPLVTAEEKKDGSHCLIAKGHTAVLSQPGTERPDRVVTYDTIFGPSASQSDVFQAVGEQVLGAVFAGFNSAVIAYGNTGAGKTHTMFGDTSSQEHKGLIPRVLEKVFAVLDSGQFEKKRVLCSYLQVYNDKLMDLADGGADNLEIKQDKSKRGKKGEFAYRVKGLTETEVSSCEEAFRIMDKGNSQRVTRAHKMNDMSSRSHAVFIVKVKFRKQGQTRSTSCSIHLLDLAGSENEAETGVSGEALVECRYINSSLISLGRVVHALHENSRRTKGKRLAVPFRETKLTHLLTDVLSGDFLCTLILNASPSPVHKQVELTAKTMAFGESAKELGAVGNEKKKAVTSKQERAGTWLTSVWKAVNSKR